MFGALGQLEVLWISGSELLRFWPYQLHAFIPDSLTVIKSNTIFQKKFFYTNVIYLIVTYFIN